MIEIEMIEMMELEIHGDDREKRCRERQRQREHVLGIPLVF